MKELILKSKDRHDKNITHTVKVSRGKDGGVDFYYEVSDFGIFLDKGSFGLYENEIKALVEWLNQKKPREFWLTKDPHYSPIQTKPMAGAIHVREVMDE